MKRLLLATLILTCALAVARQPAAAAGTVFNVDSMRVEKYGSGEPALILVPGLSSGPWAWADVTPAFAKKQTVYVVTLAGFDGTPATTSPLIDKADAALLKLIAQEHLVKPVLAGHSLGGFIALRFAELHPDALRAAIALDGLPVFPTLAQATPAQRRAAAVQAAAGLKSATPAQYLDGQKSTLATMINDPAKAAQDAFLSAKSQPGAVGDYMVELLSADLRPDLAKITVPVLELAPIIGDPKQLPPGYPDFMRNMSVQQLSDSTVGFYQGLFPGAKTVQVQPIANSRHFMMIDQPAAVIAAMTQFIESLPR